MTTRQIQPPHIQVQSFSATGEVIFNPVRHPYQLLEFYYDTAVATFKLYTKAPEWNDSTRTDAQWIEHPLSGISGNFQLEMTGPWSVKVVCNTYTSGTVYVKRYSYNDESLAVHGSMIK
jgi:hypothetical protein